MKTAPHIPQRGFTLLIAIILASVALVVGLSLADIAYKQVVLSSTAKNSQVAFYRADSAMECALYYDQQFAAFNRASAYTGSIQCENRAVANYSGSAYSNSLGSGWRTTFNVTCPGDTGVSGSITVYKAESGVCSGTSKNCLYASGYNLCSTTAPNRFERALKVLY